MKYLLRTNALGLVSALCLMNAAAFAEDPPIQIVNIKTALNINDEFQPVHPTDSFAADTSKVFLWFQWKDSQINSPINARWTYLTENIHVLDYKITIPRRGGSGGVALAMPKGKTLPPGEYEVRLEYGKTLLKSTQFRVLDK